MAIIFSGLNISKWVSLSTMKKNTKVVSGLAKAVLLSETSKDVSSIDQWDQLIEKLGVSEEQLKARLKMARLMVRIYSLLGSLLFLYGIYIVIHAHLMSGFLSLVFSMLMFSHAFKDHLFIFNCKHRKVKSTLMEWFSGTFLK